MIFDSMARFLWGYCYTVIRREIFIYKVVGFTGAEFHAEQGLPAYSCSALSDLPLGLTQSFFCYLLMLQHTGTGKS